MEIPAVKRNEPTLHIVHFEQMAKVTRKKSSWPVRLKHICEHGGKRRRTKHTSARCLST